MPSNIPSGTTLTLSVLDANLAVLMREHVAHLGALRDVAKLADSLETKDDSSILRAIGSLPEFSTDVIEKALVGGKLLFEAALEIEPSEPIVVDESVQLEIDGDDSGNRTVSVTIADPDLSGVLAALMLESTAVIGAPAESALVRSSLLTMVVGAFEGLVGDLAAI